MAINKNHEFEELDGVKCGIVEKNVLPARVEFLKPLLMFNGYEVIVVPTSAPKAVPLSAGTKPVVEGEAPPPSPPTIPTPETFIVGVTDYTFNSINAIFGRLLKTTDGKIVTLAYWKQEEAVSNDEVPYLGNVIS